MFVTNKYKKIICGSFISHMLHGQTNTQAKNKTTKQNQGEVEGMVVWGSKEAFCFPDIISRKINILSECYSTHT